MYQTKTYVILGHTNFHLPDMTYSVVSSIQII